MVKKLIGALTLCLLLSSAFGITAEAKKKSRRAKAKTTATTTEQKVLGKHMLSLQWISWDYFGEVNIFKDDAGRIRCMGRQESRENDDFVSLDGIITIVDAKHLKFDGNITTKVYHINNGQAVIREGEFDFVAKDNRKYWRLQQMKNPADSCIDYVDIYFKR